MGTPGVNTVIPGFSLPDRWLLYASLLLTPTQLLCGFKSMAPINLGFIAFNIYQQYLWYIAAKTKQLHALALLPAYLNLIYSITYIGGVTSGSWFISIPCALGTAALIILNTITAWVSVTTNLPDGYGTYRFFFFGWRTLTKGWRTFFIIWEVSDTVIAVAMIVGAFFVGGGSPAMSQELSPPDDETLKVAQYSSLLWGPLAVMVLVGWELIMWMELIVKENHIESATDMIAVYLFIAQVVLMLVPFLIDLVKAIFL